MTPTEQDKELRVLLDEFVLYTDSSPESNEPTELKLFMEQCGFPDAIDRLYSELMQLITADRKRVALEASDREARLLNALAGMYEQYCGKKYGHDFMGAGEEAISILEDYGVHDEAWEWGEKSDKNLSRALARIKAQQEEV